MRVVLATPAPTAGGVWRHVEDLAHGLRHDGHDVVLGLAPAATALQRAAVAAGLPWIDLQRSAAVGSDVWHLHLHNTLDARGARALAARRARGRTRVVLTEHLPRTFRTDPGLAVDPTMPPGRRKPGAAAAKTALKRAQLRAAHRLVAVSAASAEFLARRYRLDRDAIDVVYNGVAVPDLVRPADDGPRLRVVVVGVLSWRKGQDLVLAAARLAAEPWAITFVGDGDERAALERAAAGLDVTFTGWRDDGARAAADADVLVLASRGESFSYVPLEAMALGRAVVAADVDGMDEMIEDGVSGLLVPPEDAAALAAALDRLARRRDVARALGQAAHARVAARFDRATMIARTVDVYRGALAA